MIRSLIIAGIALVLVGGVHAASGSGTLAAPQLMPTRQR